MNKHSQDRIPRLAIVGPTNKAQHRQPAVLRWWGPQRAQFPGSNDRKFPQNPTSKTPMAVMPELPRSLTTAAIAWMWKFVRDYFVTATEPRQGAAVLSFRRYANQGRGFRRAAANDGFASKKSSGSIGWGSDHQVAPQEGGGR